MPTEIKAKGLLNKAKHPSSWFGIEYGFNVYRGCQHGCIYCDTRSECYGIDNFEEVTVKMNAPKLLAQSLSRMRKRAVLGTGAASDPYIPLELDYKITRQCLKTISERRFGISLCTKSNLILRDIDLLSKINEVYACVQFTITTPDDCLAAVTEPNAPPPSKRYEAMGILSSAGIETGITMMPLLPYINESEDDMRTLVRKAKQFGATFIVPAFGMTLRDRQRAYYYDKLDQSFPGLRQKYEKRFGSRYSCGVTNYNKLRRVFEEECRAAGISTKMPSYSKKVSAYQLSFLGEQET